MLKLAHIRLPKLHSICSTSYASLYRSPQLPKKCNHLMHQVSVASKNVVHHFPQPKTHPTLFTVSSTLAFGQ